MKLQLPKFLLDTSNPAGYSVRVVIDFVNGSTRLVRKCTKPDRKEYMRILNACGVGFLIMGFIGYFVKLLFIPVNNILVDMLVLRS
ncbi:protein translocation complex gamma subunit, putative [Theileria equi strain WA]|uniref:Protein translocation complex gamma subunit, putative n=1 Tax=Theileria equi strain WA TaxID=1537102 RepID=L1LCJ9_THEEQ|nr:protein translocation complex gamma subunit, putative [Theileria equi strain WA]EKX72883.1 protein translocation complex gamma subunit, putative [Theileria equi strain WA]|eukprot:XP_004832335.1 protein translocation complex gamma subunit, putative [Theileria equi strain WA]